MADNFHNGIDEGAIQWEHASNKLFYVYQCHLISYILVTREWSPWYFVCVSIILSIFLLTEKENSHPICYSSIMHQLCISLTSILNGYRAAAVLIKPRWLGDIKKFSSKSLIVVHDKAKKNKMQKRCGKDKTHFSYSWLFQLMFSFNWSN